MSTAAVRTTAVHRRRAGSGAARRALLRWALRLFRREWRQQLLVLVLLALAVATTLVGIALAVTATEAQAPEFGHARQIIDLGRADAARRAADVAAARTAFGAAESIAHAQLVVPGVAEPIDVRDQDPTAPMGAPLVRLRAGRLPAVASEVALTDDATTLLAARIGDTVDVAGAARTVVGVVENPRRLSDDFALVVPGSIAEPDHVDLLIAATDGALRGFHLPGVPNVIVRGYSPVRTAQAAGLVLAIACVGMLFVGLLSVAGFAVMAQRRRRALGMLGALGATDRQVRQALVASGAVTGAAGGIAGAAVGLVLWALVAGRLEGPLDHRVGRLDVPWWAVGATVVLAVATAMGAAWWPARSAARLSAVGALSGRPPDVAPAHRSAAAGAVLLGAGGALLAISHQRTGWAIVSGSIATVVGMLLLAPLAVRLLGATARRLPLPARLAVRDLARYRARSGAAVGAAALALGVAATVSLGASVASANRSASGVRGNLPADELMIYAGRPDGGPTPVLEGAALDKARAAVADIVAATSATASTELTMTRDPNAPTIDLDGVSGTLATALVDPDVVDGKTIGFRLVAPLYVADDNVLRYMGIDPTAIPAGTDVVSARRDVATTEIVTVKVDPASKQRDQVEVKPALHRLDTPVYESQPNTLIAPATVARLGLTTFPAVWAVRTAKPVTTDDLARIHAVAGAAGLTVETRVPGPAYDRVSNYATAVGMVVALAVVAMSVGLIRAEAAGELRTLAATGASDRTRRAIVAVTAGALGLLGGVLAVVGAYVAVVAWQRSHLTPLRSVPVANLAAIVAGLPVLAMFGAWLLAGREPTDIGRARLD